MPHKIIPGRYATSLYRRTYKSEKLIKTSQIVFAAEVMFIVVVYVSKIAVGLLLHRLASQRFKRTYAIAVVAICGACCVASVLAVAVQDTGTPWLPSQKSASSIVREVPSIWIFSPDHLDTCADEPMDSLRRHEQSPGHLPLNHPGANNPRPPNADLEET
jgi:hypothetical protein